MWPVISFAALVFFLFFIYQLTKSCKADKFHVDSPSLLIAELLEQPDASGKMNQQIVDKVVPHIKMALSNDARFEAGLNSLETLSNVVHHALNIHLKGIMQQLAKKCNNRLVECQLS